MHDHRESKLRILPLSTDIIVRRKMSYGQKIIIIKEFHLRICTFGLVEAFLLLRNEVR